MTLPKIDMPIYELKLPSSGKEIKVRPFIVKEEKLLLMAAETNDTEEIIKTTKQIINNCIIETPGDKNFDIDKLPFFDVDYLFIALRAKSVGEKIDMSFTCNNVTEEGNKCNHVFDEAIDIADARVVKPKDISDVIELGNNIKVKMKYPSYTIMKVLNEKDNVLDKKIKVMANCIDSVIRGDLVMQSKDFSKKELESFVESLSKEQFLKIEEFVDNFPYFAVNLHHKCEKCGFDHTIEYRDFTLFFR